MRKIGLGMLGVILSYGIHVGAAMADAYVECRDCNHSARVGAAHDWRRVNPSAPADTLVHVVDMKQKEISSFTTKLNPPTPPNQGPPRVTISVFNATTPPAVQAYMNNVRSASSQYRSTISGTPIPTSVIPNAWQMVSCAFCENDIETWIRAQAGAQKVLLIESIDALLQAFGIQQTSIADIYVIQLESGGYVEVEISVTNEPVEIDVRVVKVVDKDNNSVPISAQQLNNLTIRLSGGSAVIVNRYINPFQFYVPSVQGIVTIVECPPPNPNGNDPCYR